MLVFALRMHVLLDFSIVHKKIEKSSIKLEKASKNMERFFINIDDKDFERSSVKKGNVQTHF